MMSKSLLLEGAVPSTDEIQCGVEKLRKKNKLLVEKYDAKCKDLQVRFGCIMLAQTNVSFGNRSSSDGAQVYSSD